MRTDHLVNPTFRISLLKERKSLRISLLKERKSLMSLLPASPSRKTWKKSTSTHAFVYIRACVCQGMRYVASSRFSICACLDKTPYLDTHTHSLGPAQLSRARARDQVYVSCVLVLLLLKQCSTLETRSCSVLQCAAVCCSVLQCVAVCCSVLQCVVVCCSVLQCVAVCCSALCLETRPQALACRGGRGRG